MKLHDTRTAAERVKHTLQQGLPEDYLTACRDLYVAYHVKPRPVSLAPAPYEREVR